MIRTLASAAALGMAALAAAGQAQATTGLAVPDFTGSTECTSNTADVGGNPCQIGGAKASYAPSPFAAVQATASGAVNDGNHGASAFLTYFYTIDGPDNGPIKIDIDTDLLTMASPNPDTAFASLEDTEGHQLCATINQIGCFGHTSLNGELVEMESPGIIYSIHLEAVASESGVVGGSAFASADPFIGIDPLDINAGAYSIRLSNGVVNGLPSAPEPAAWALMLLGFGALGAALRARRGSPTEPVGGRARVA